MLSFFLLLLFCTDRSAFGKLPWFDETYCPEGWTFYDSAQTCFIASDTPGTWRAANKSCEEMSTDGSVCTAFTGQFVFESINHFQFYRERLLQFKACLTIMSWIRSSVDVRHLKGSEESWMMVRQTSQWKSGMRRRVGMGSPATFASKTCGGMWKVLTLRLNCIRISMQFHL